MGFRELTKKNNYLVSIVVLCSAGPDSLRLPSVSSLTDTFKNTAFLFALTLFFNMLRPPSPPLLCFHLRVPSSHSRSLSPCSTLHPSEVTESQTLDILNPHFTFKVYTVYTYYTVSICSFNKDVDDEDIESVNNLTSSDFCCSSSPRQRANSDSAAAEALTDDAVPFVSKLSRSVHAHTPTNTHKHQPYHNLPRHHAVPALCSAGPDASIVPTPPMMMPNPD